MCKRGELSSVCDELQAKAGSLAHSVCRSAGQGHSKVALSRDFKETVKERAERGPASAKAMPDEAATAFLNGEAHVARLILRDVVNASVGFEELATETNRPSKSLHRML
jgi:Ribonuclease G/E